MGPAGASEPRGLEVVMRIIKILGWTAVLLLSLSFAGCGAPRKAPDYDLIIANGRVIDGTGNPWFYADVAIRGDSVAAVGRLKGRSASRIIDARGQVVTPGFIDMHTHCESGLSSAALKANLNYITQGVTTVVTGNCGYGPLKVLEASRAMTNIGTNAVILAGFGTIRREVLGTDNRTPSAEELERMKSILRRAMEEGAWGLSTGLQYIPDRYAGTEEIIALARVVAEFGGIYSSHMRSEEENLLDAVRETIRIGEESGARANISHFKATGKPNWGSLEKAVRLVREARERGVEITADMYPYRNSATVPLQIVFSVPPGMGPFDELEKMAAREGIGGEEGAALAARYAGELTKALRDPEARERIRKTTEDGLPDRVNWVAKGGWQNFSIMSSLKHAELIGRMFCDLAAERKRSEFDIAADLYLEEGDGVTISLSTMSEDDVLQALRQPWTMLGSDGSVVAEGESSVHPRNFGTFPRVLRKYVREEGVLGLEEAVRKMTSLPAMLLRLEDRGLVKPGCKADLVVFDPGTVRDEATFDTPQRISTGISHVLVNGKISLENGQVTDASHGVVLLRQTP
jgi:N-acyl-D-aspartate/D-glutamate deacylase